MDEGRALLLFGKKLQGEFDKDDAIELLRALDFMPLAISQAAAYICQRAPRLTVARYLEDFCKSDKNRANLLNSDAGDLRRDSEASNSVLTTWQISFEYIRGKRPSAARLLSLMSFFDRQGIPESLLHCYDDGDDSTIDLKDQTDISLEDNSEVEFEDDMCTLRSYSLITANVEDQFEMHRIVQLSTRKWLEQNSELEKWKKKFIRIIWKTFPFGEYENWTICQVLFPHAEAVLAYRPVEKQDLVFWSEVLTNAGNYAARQGNYSMAEEMNRRALDGHEKALGEEHRSTLINLGSLALVLGEQGKYQSAEEMSRRALYGMEKALGKEHPDTLTSGNNLAYVLGPQGKHKAEEEMFRQALYGMEKALGKEHPYTLKNVNNLAEVLVNQGKYETVEEMSRRALYGMKKALGKEHPDTLASGNNLAYVLGLQGKHEAAEEIRHWGKRARLR